MARISWPRPKSISSSSSSLLQNLPLHPCYEDRNILTKAMDSLYVPSSAISYMDLSSKFSQAMVACRNHKSLFDAQKIHARLISIGLSSSVFLQNHLLNLYATCNSSGDTFQVFREIKNPNIFSWNNLITGLANTGKSNIARQVFDKMPERDSVSWNAMMTAYFHDGLCEEAIMIFISMVEVSRFDIDPLSFSCALKACASLRKLELGLQLHALLMKFDFGGDSILETSVLDMYIKCEAIGSANQVFEQMVAPSMFCWNSMILGCSKSYGVGQALDLFHRMPERDIVSWNTVISILSQHGCGTQTLSTFIEMQNQGLMPNSTTYASVLSACACILDLEWGKHLHARIVRSGLSSDIFVGSALIDMYAKCGYLEVSHQVFVSLPVCNAVSWTSIIAGFAHSGLEEEALLLFAQMREASVPSDQFTLATVLGACSSKKNLVLAVQLHSYVIQVGYDSSVPVANALLSVYSKCGSVEIAEHLYSLMPIRDIISCTTMITAFSQMGDFKKARAYFNKMPDRNIVTWNSMLAAYIQHGYVEQGLKMYILLLREESVKPDWITLVTLLSACAEVAVLRLGNQIVAQTVKRGFDLDVSVANGIVTMYAKCGKIEEARETFYSITNKDLVSWNAIITGFAQNGLGKKSVEMFEELLKTGTKPDYISYIGVLSGCSHSGLVSEGKYYFNSMTKDHNIRARSEHFACMVDLLGRAGLLKEAKNVIDGMPIEPSPAVWGALLGASRIHNNTKFAESAVKHLLELNQKESGSYVLLANIYSDAGKLDGVAEVRKLMRERGVRKNPGCSWIEVDNRIHVFTVDDTNHPRIKEVQIMLDEIIEKIKAKGYVTKIQNRSRSYHSEKLAVAFGLISSPSWMPIHIMKNLRVCGDCHTMMKFTSHVMSRELIVRDANRFHHFSKGSCSCGDYW